MKLKVELIWWIVTALVVIVVLYPIMSKLDDYRFLLQNIIFIVVFITVVRHIFLLEQSYLAGKKYLLKFLCIVACIPLLAYMIQEVNGFQAYLDNLDDKGWDSFFGEIPLPKQKEIHGYMRSEMLFFGTGAIISCVLFPIRMIISVWRLWNKGRE